MYSTKTWRFHAMMSHSTVCDTIFSTKQIHPTTVMSAQYCVCEEARRVWKYVRVCLCKRNGPDGVCVRRAWRCVHLCKQESLDMYMCVYLNISTLQ